jgi:hypothetical protein
VAAGVTDLPSELKRVDVGAVAAGGSHDVLLEHPVETAVKKLVYRGSMLKVRDVFDIAVVHGLFPDLLPANLRHAAPLKRAILARLDGIPEDYFRLEIEELDLAKEWRQRAAACRDRVRDLIAVIPD